MNVEAWHFLVSRNRHLDYRTVVAPDFICKAKIYNLLARVADGDLTEPKKGFFRQITGSKAGDFSIVFRVLKAKKKYLDFDSETEILKDTFGRKIYLIEGLVVKGIWNKKDFLVANQDIEEAHKLLMEEYRQFWEYSKPNPAIPSHKFPLTMDSYSITLQLEELQPFQVSSKVRNLQNKSKVNLAAFLVTIIVILMLAIWLTTIGYPFGGNILNGCTLIQEIPIEFRSKDEIDSIINNSRITWPKNYLNAKIFLNGDLKLESLDNLNFLKKRKEQIKDYQYTFSLNDYNSLHMQDHLLELAIAQFCNKKIVDKTTNIKALIINKKEYK